MLASRSISVADYSRGCSQDTKHEQAQHPDVCAPGWSQCRSQVAHPFPSATTGRSPGPAAWRQPLVKFSCSQIHIVSSEDPNVPPTHVRFIQLSLPGVPSATVAIADSRQSMFIQSSSNTTELNRVCKKRTAIRCARGSDGNSVRISSAQFIRLRFILHRTILEPIELKWNSV